MAMSAHANQLTKEDARQLTEEIRSTAGRLDQLLKRAYAEGAWRVLGYEGWSAYVDEEFAELNRAWRYTWRAYGEVSDTLGVNSIDAPVVTNYQAQKIRPHLEIVKERIEEENLANAPPEKKLELAREVVREQQSKAHDYATAACRIRPPSEMLLKIDYYLEAILDPIRYELSDKDKVKLHRMLTLSLKKLEIPNGATAQSQSSIA